MTPVRSAAAVDLCSGSSEQKRKRDTMDRVSLFALQILFRSPQPFAPLDLSRKKGRGQVSPDGRLFRIPCPPRRAGGLRGNWWSQLRFGRRGTFATGKPRPRKARRVSGNGISAEMSAPDAPLDAQKIIAAFPANTETQQKKVTTLVVTFFGAAGRT